MGTQIGHRLKPGKTKFGRFIRAHRLKLDLSQGQLAKSAGATQTSISSLETGRAKRPGEKLLARLSKALKCELAQLKKLLPKKPVDEPTTGLGKLIESRLLALNLTPNDLRKKLDVSDACVANWLTGQSLSVSYGMLKPLADALKLELADLSEFALKKDKPVKIAFGWLIRDQRKKMGLSGQALAKIAGTTRASISLAEHRGICSKKLAKKLAEKLELAPADLLALKPKRKKRKTSMKLSL